MPKISRQQAGLQPPRAIVKLNASLMTAHYVGESPWGHVDRSSPESFRRAIDHNRCSTLWKGIWSYHTNGRGYQDIAYNFGVCPHGYVFEGRGPGVKSGAQLGNINNQTYAWCYIGGAGDPFTPQAGLAVTEETTTSYGLLTTRDHSTWAKTSCAGESIRAAVREWNNGNLPRPVPHPTPTPTPVPSGGTVVVTLPVLKIGAKGGAVISLQTLLNTKAGQGITVDGSFGSATDTAVRNVQRFFGLTVDGIVGKDSWGVLFL